MNNSIKVVKKEDVYTGITSNNELVLSVPDNVIIDDVKVESDLSTTELENIEVISNAISISFDNIKAKEYVTLSVLYETSELGYRPTPQDNDQQDNMLIIARSPKFYSKSTVDDLDFTNISEYILRSDHSSPNMSSAFLIMFSFMTMIILFITINTYYIKFTTNEPIPYTLLIVLPILVIGMTIALRFFYNKFTKGLAQIPKILRKILLKKYNKC